MIAYDYDSNNILAESLKSRTCLHIKKYISDNAEITMQQRTNAKDTRVRQRVLQGFEIIHGRGHTFFQAFKNHSYPLAPFVTITALQNLIQKG